MALASLRQRGSLHGPAAQTANVTVLGYFYSVAFADDGSSNNSGVHRVGKDRRCTCPLGQRCPAVTAVAAYLRAGGERAPDPPPGYYPVAPACCPICGFPVVFDNRLSSVRRGAGWRCKETGSLHYWQVHMQVLRQKLAANRWLFPPIVLREGEHLRAYDGILPGDTVLFPGLLREGVIIHQEGE